MKERDHVVIGANRLPIQGRETGVQPVSNEDKTVRACLNGEIFNCLSLKQSLKEKGHIFSTECDTEVLVHLYEEHGENMAKHIDSEMFAGIVYDTAKDLLCAFRDPLGVKPLYYAYHNDGTLHLASEMKQLSQFPDITTIHNFPKGHFFSQGKFTKYISFSDEETHMDEKKIIDTLAATLVAAVRKRVQADLPIGVFLSGGVDSSLIMELANRFHPNVTAIILGHEDSDDYKYAVKLCMEKGYKYSVIKPGDSYENIDEVIYYTETFEPNIIRHTFANDFCSKRAKELGIDIVLCGEGADELFAGYKEFLQLPQNKIAPGCLRMVEDLEYSQLKRADRSSMRYTVEVRCPFLDTMMVKKALHIASNLKVTQGVTKDILRRIAQQFLPAYITDRPKEPFANGAGMNVGYAFKTGDGDVAKYAEQHYTGKISPDEKEKYGLTTIEEYYAFSQYKTYGYAKYIDSNRRALTKDSLLAMVSLDVLRAVTAKAFCKSVDTKLQISDYIFNHYKQKKPLQPLLFRGCSDKPHIDTHDTKTMDRLHTYLQNIQMVYPYGVFTSVILSDAHGIVNGYNQENIRTYLPQIEKYLGTIGIETCYLSEIYNENDYNTKIFTESIENFQRPSSAEEAIFTHSAFTLFGASKNIPYLAKRYYMMRSSEKSFIEKKYKDYLLFVYGNPNLSSCLPQLPKVYLWTEGRNYSNTPRFMIS